MEKRDAESEKPAELRKEGIVIVGNDKDKTRNVNNILWRTKTVEEVVQRNRETIASLDKRLAVIESMLTHEVMAKILTHVQRSDQAVEDFYKDSAAMHAQLESVKGELPKTFQALKNTHDKDCNKINDRIDEIQLRSQRYYSVVSPEGIQTTLEEVHKTQADLIDLRSQYTQFVGDRIKRLEVADEKIDRVREFAQTIENKVMHRIESNQIRNQQYVIAIVVGIIVTFLSSIVLAYLRI